MKISNLCYAWHPHITNVESETYPHTLVMITQLVSGRSGMRPLGAHPTVPIRTQSCLGSDTGCSQFS